MKIIYFNH